MDENTIICRCSDVTLRKSELIKDGYVTFDEIKRITRAGMGPPGQDMRSVDNEGNCKYYRSKYERYKIPNQQASCCGS